MSAIKEVALVPKDEQALKPTSADLFERLARDPGVDVDKLERLMQMHERASARVAEERFNAAMTLAQQEMRPVARDAENPQTRSRYTSYAALDNALRPIYTGQGFGLSFDTGDAPIADMVRVLCYVTHRDGFAKTYRVDMPADGKGARGGDVMTKTHAVGAAMSYGMRYLLKMIFNVACGDGDRDGNHQPAKPARQEPVGFANWRTDLRAVADNGIDALRKMWKDSKPEFCDYLTIVDPDEIKRLGERARKVAVKS